jgi:nicotinamidase-related amidase
VKNAYHGLPPDRAATVLIILDMISDFRFPDGPQILRAARRIAPRILALKQRVKDANLATIYVNDNLGLWRSDMPRLVAHCSGPDSKGADVTETLAPHPRDYFILKPRHSACFATPLDVLLNHLQAERLILTGVTSHQCVLFTANDAHVRSFELIVPRDCIGGPKAADDRFALKYFSSVLQADTRPSTSLRLSGKRTGSRKPPARSL